ncbi:aldo/keto reductase [Bifidobacterium sp. LC6]|uniref:Aldo/keto reductase n=1 Tax=Bifidobacterium colobi TaxID=2809026 RepID=A0ABS5UVT1_9BIFI|nr:aldo/keto reductase [Bifidobacterium colobi]MBT1174709.1 aldo/keto reductase [Bifidobacterium colobi]
MEYTKLGNSDVTVSRICMGCMGFGDATKGHHSWILDADQSHEIIKYGFEHGITFYDTAIGYADGTSEEYVGRALRSIASKREDYQVATKFLPCTDAEREAGVTGQQHVLNNLDASLKHLGLDYVDLYICHMWDYHTDMAEIMEGMNEAVKAGKVRAIGISNCYAYQLAKMNALAETNGWAKFVSIQSHYNLIAREDERELTKLCKEDNIAMTPYSALAAGRLARKPGSAATKRLTEDQVAHSKYDATEAQDDVIIERVAEVAAKRGTSMTAVSLAWLLTKVTAPVVGMTKPHHVDGALDAVALKLTDEEIAYLEEPYVPHKLVGVMAFNH